MLRPAPDTLAYFIAIVTYIILVPWILFVELTFGRGWRSSVRALLYGVTALAMIEIASDVVRRDPLSMWFENNIAVILSLAVLIPNLYWVRRRHIPGLRVTGAGLLVFAAFVLNANLGRFSMRPSNFDLEPLGFLVFLCCLGDVAVRRSIAAEQRLIAIEQELETARRIQASILPRKLPDLPGLDVAARYLPMTAVAGDFYDFLVVDGARLGILVADVSGHGVPAALVASMVKVAFASQAPHASEPPRVLSGLNEILSGKLEGQFVTAGYAFLDLATRSLVCAGAGHPPLLLVRQAGRRIIELQENGLFLGPFRHATYRETRHSVEAGDRMLLYTDGILEAAGPSAEPFGDRQFPKFIHGHAHLAASDFADALLQTLSRWSNQHNGGGQEDDLTLIIVDITNSQPPIPNPPLL